MTVLLAAVVASALVDGGGTAVALDDGTVWMVYDGEWEELGACEDGEVIGLEAAGAQLLVECGDGTSWSWSDDAGWAPRLELGSMIVVDLELPATRSWWPLLELTARMRTGVRDQPVYEGWVRLRWDL